MTGTKPSRRILSLLEMDDESVRKIPKIFYKNFIQKKVEKAAFLSYLEEKEKSKKKMHQLKYNSLHIQCYMTDSSFTHNEIKLLFSLRSNCYPAKMNFKKMHKGDLKCFFIVMNMKPAYIFSKIANQ